MIDRDPPTVPTYHLFDQPADKAVQAERSRPWAADEFSFHDLLDIINPLQHLPVISSIYRYITGDEIGNVPRIAGDALYGGPLGFVSGLIGAALKQDSGKDVGEHLVAMVTGESAADPAGKPADPTVQVAASDGKASAAAATATAQVVANAASVGATSNTTGTAMGVGSSGATAPIGKTASGLPLASAQSTTASDSDPRVAFLARGDAMRRLAGAGGPTGPVARNHPIPIQGISLPPSFGVAKYPSTATAPATASTAAASAGATATNIPPAGSLPSNPPIDISQQMLDALDKYARLQQQRGAQVDVVH